MGALVGVSGESAVGRSQPGHDHGRHTRGERQHSHEADAGRLVNQADAGSSRGVPDAPMQCILAAGCGVAVIAAPVILIETPAHVAGGVFGDVALAPDSPAPGLEPPPPRV